MTPAEALGRIAALGDPVRARHMRAYHKVVRPYLGVGVPVLNGLAAAWRVELALPERLALARGLWSSGVFEARVAAGKILTQARIRPDDGEVWRTIAGWVPGFDSWAIADHVSKAGAQRLTAAPDRLDEVEGWVASSHLWTRRAALVMTLPWARLADPSPADRERRERILRWAAEIAAESTWFLQKAVAWWLRDLSKRDPDQVRAFLDRHGARLKPFARREAARCLR